MWQMICHAYWVVGERMSEARQPREAHPEAVADALNRRFRPALMAYFLRRIRRHSEAEDLTHEVLLRLAERGVSVDADRPDAYVFQIATNLLRDQGRRDKVRRDYAATNLPEEVSIEVRDPYRVMEAKQSLEVVLETLRGLPERTRTIFILFRLEKMRQREIAETLGISVRTVEQHVLRATIELRASLSGER
ncbi:MAG: sigma-70 family RNA polymerase sigma factor [Sphingomonas sp.]